MIIIAHNIILIAIQAKHGKSYRKYKSGLNIHFDIFIRFYLHISIFMFTFAAEFDYSSN